QEPEKLRQHSFRNQEMVRLQALVGRRVGMTFIQNHKFMQERRARAPMAENKYGRMLDSRLPYLVAQQGILEETQDRMATADASDDGRDVPIGQLHGKAVPPKQAKPGRQIATFPKSRRPFAPLVLLVSSFSHARHQFKGTAHSGIGAFCTPTLPAKMPFPQPNS